MSASIKIPKINLRELAAKVKGIASGAFRNVGYQDNDLAIWADVKRDRKNYIINGNFDIWQRGTTFNAISNAGYSADRWVAVFSGTAPTVNITQQALVLGQTDIPNESEYYLRYTATNVTGTTALTLCHRIEGARTLAGEQVTLSFYMKATTATTLGVVRLRQSFGTGGSGAQNSDMGVDSTAITTVWKKFTATVTIASIAGETIAGGGDYLQLQLFLPIQINTFDIAQVQLEKGSVATDFEYRPVGEELALCQRYFQIIKTGMTFYSGATATWRWQTAFATEMRVDPTATVTVNSGTVVINISGTTRVEAQHGSAPVGISVDRATIDLDAEL